MACTRGGAGNVSVKAYGIGGRGHVAYSGNAAFYISDNFIHAHYEDDMAWSLNQTCNTVSVAVNIDQFAV